MHFTQDTFARSLASYQAAIDKLFAICPELQFRGTGHTILGALQGHLEPDYSADQTPLFPHATDLTIEHTKLFEYRRPREASDYIWDQEFFTVGFSIVVPWISYTNERARTGTRTFSDGRPSEDFSEPARIDEHTYRVEFQGRNKSWTLRQWRSHAAEIAAYGLLFPEKSHEEYNQCVANASAEIARWLAAVNEKPVVSLP